MSAEQLNQNDQTNTLPPPSPETPMLEPWAGHNPDTLPVPVVQLSQEQAPRPEGEPSRLDSLRIAYHGLVAAGAHRRMEWAGSKLAETDRELRLINHQAHVTKQRALITVAEGGKDATTARITGLNQFDRAQQDPADGRAILPPRPRSRRDRRVAIKHEKAISRVAERNIRLYREQKLNGINGGDTHKRGSLQRRLNHHKDINERSKPIEQAFRNGAITAAERELQLSNIKATPRAFKSPYHQGVEKRLTRSQKRLTKVTAQSPRTTYLQQDWRKQVEAIKQNHFRNEHHQERIQKIKDAAKPRKESRMRQISNGLHNNVSELRVADNWGQAGRLLQEIDLHEKGLDIDGRPSSKKFDEIIEEKWAKTQKLQLKAQALEKIARNRRKKR